MFVAKIFTFLASLLFTLATATNVNRCSRGERLPISVDVKGCPRQPCTVFKGSSVFMDVRFAGIRDNTKNITAKVQASATVLGFPITYELPVQTANVCSNLLNDSTCPINKGDEVVYKFVLVVQNWYPVMGVRVQVFLEDELKQIVVCFWANVKVRKGRRT